MMKTPRTIRTLPASLAGALLALLLIAACDSGLDPSQPIGRSVQSEDGNSRDAMSTSADGAAIPSIRLRPAFTNLRYRRPLQLAHAGDDSGRLFVVEQNGRILVFENDPTVSQHDVFLDIGDKVRRRHNEEGLLALAFHPDFATNRQFFIYYSASNPRRGVLSRFTANADDPNKTNPDSEKIIFEIEQPWGNHNGCSLNFGPDGYLYFSLGDGGSANDPLNSGQDLSTLLGAILRIDVDNEEAGRAYAIPDDNPFVDRPDARDEIWAYGLRNVWRMSFDPETGDLWAGDVGQNEYEEIDLITKGGNYGWRLREGKHPFTSGQPDGELIDPVVEYDHSLGLSITGGYVYRGDRYPQMQGVYLYADYVTGRIWGLRYDDGAMTAHREVLAARRRPPVASFGVDANGELYICAFDRPDGYGGAIYRIEAF